MKRQFGIPRGRKWPNGPYIITEYGKIFSLISNRYVKPDRNSQVKLRLRAPDNPDITKSAKYYTHRLTAQMYVPNPDPSQFTEVVKEGNTGHYTSLKWVKHSDIKRVKRSISLVP